MMVILLTIVGLVAWIWLACSVVVALMLAVDWLRGIRDVKARDAWPLILLGPCTIMAEIYIRIGDRDDAY